MNSLIHFLEPLFNRFLFNYKDLTLIEISIFCAVLLFGTMGKLVAQKPNTSIASTGYFISVVLFLSSSRLSFLELVWWKALINIVVSLIVFVIISEILLSLSIILFGGFYHYSNDEIRPKRRTAFLVLTIFAINLIVNKHLIKGIF